MVLRVLCFLALALASTAWRAPAQAVEHRSDVWSYDDPGSERLEQHPLTLPTLLTPKGLVLRPAVEANRRRPGWLFPAVGAAVGGALFSYLTYRACQGEDCIFPVAPPLFGIGLGALFGWGVDAVTRPD